MLLKWLIRWL